MSNVKSLGNKTILAASSIAGTVSPLQAVDIGTPGDPIQPGATYPVGDGAFDVVAGGSDTWGNQDHFHYAYQSWNGDFDTQVQVTRLEQGGIYAKASLMMRQDFSAGSPNAKVDLTSFAANNSNEAQERVTQDGPTSSWGFSSGTASSQPWLRLKRQGSTLTAFKSSDGVSWIQLGTIERSFTDPVLLGLATSANINTPGSAALAQYRNFSISVPPPLLTV